MVTQNRKDGKICTRAHESFPRSDFLQHESGTARGLWFQPVTSDVWKLTWIIPSSRESREAKIRENGHWGDILTALTDAASQYRLSRPGLRWKGVTPGHLHVSLAIYWIWDHVICDFVYRCLCNYSILLLVALVWLYNGKWCYQVLIPWYLNEHHIHIQFYWYSKVIHRIPWYYHDTTSINMEIQWCNCDYWLLVLQVMLHLTMGINVLPFFYNN